MFCKKEIIIKNKELLDSVFSINVNENLNNFQLDIFEKILFDPKVILNNSIIESAKELNTSKSVLWNISKKIKCINYDQFKLKIKEYIDKKALFSNNDLKNFDFYKNNDFFKDSTSFLLNDFLNKFEIKIIDKIANLILNSNRIIFSCRSESYPIARDAYDFLTSIGFDTVLSIFPKNFIYRLVSIKPKNLVVFFNNITDELEAAVEYLLNTKNEIILITQDKKYQNFQSKFSSINILYLPNYYNLPFVTQRFEFYGILNILSYQLLKSKKVKNNLDKINDLKKIKAFKKSD